MSSRSLDYVIILTQGFVIALLGYNFLTQGRNLLQPDRIKNASQMMLTGLALTLLGFIIGVAAAVRLIFNA